MSSESLGVFLHGERAGRLERAADGGLCFRYAPRYLATPAARAVSLGIPLGDRAHGGDGVRRFFDGLLPRGDLRTAICQRHGLAGDDTLALLEILAGDCPGAVSLAAGEAPVRQQGYLEISRIQLSRLAANPPVLPQLSGVGGVRLTLPGARDKLPVYLDGSHIYLPMGGSPTSHLLKFGSHEDLANEVATNQLARGLGLAVPEMAMVATGSVSMVVIKRFDRALDAQGRLRRRHQQDLGQALGADPDPQIPGRARPSLARCFQLLAAHSLEPALDLEALLRWQVFNRLVNGSGGRPEDLTVTLSAGGVRLTPSCGLRSGIGSGADAGGVAPEVWRALASQVGVKERYLLNLVSEMNVRLPAVTAAVVEEFQRRYGEVPSRSQSEADS